MRIKYGDQSPEGKAREALIEQVLPKKTLIETMLRPKLDVMKPLLLKMLYAELEIYRAYPKKPLETVEKAKEAEKTFDPRNNKTCFQGKGFRGNDDITDNELYEYRKAVGTFNHSEWGDCTLLEVWGGDHFELYPAMVKAAFKYGSGINKTRPILKFHVNPLFKNKHTGVTKLSKEQKAHKKVMDHLLAEAQMFGTKAPARIKKLRYKEDD